MIAHRTNAYLSSDFFYATFIPIVMTNAIISMIISFPLLNFHGQQVTVWHLFSMVTFVAHYFLLNLVVGLLAFCFLFLCSKRIAVLVMGALFFFFQVFLVFDTKIYTIFRYHINPLVLNVITTEGVSDSVMLGKGTIAYLLAIVAGILGAEIILHRYFITGVQKMRGNFLIRLRRFAKASFFIGLLLILIEKGAYAYADVVNNTVITQHAKLFPLYQPFTVKRFVSTVFKIQVNREEDFQLSVASTTLRYPKNILRFEPRLDKKFNVLLIVVDGLRFDMLNQEVMPRVWDFSRNNISFTNHYSGGNGTRFGIFSLFYGIDGTYWHNVLARRISPILVDTLIEKGYAFSILSSTRLTFPEFRKTVFIKIPESIQDQFGTTTAAERDAIITERVIRFISRRKNETPFFAFVFYDSSHQPYLYPEKFERFRPAGDPEINYFKDISKEGISILKNRYQNAIYYNDHLIGKIIDALAKDDLLKKTIVVVTGDHGEEFYENGYFGHTSSFDDYQIKVPFVLHYPNAEPALVERLTSHADLVPTIMETLGCISPSEDYSHGVSLLGKERHNYVTAANWDTSAIIDDEHKVVFSTEMYNLRLFEVRRRADYSIVENQRDVIRQKKGLLLDTACRISEFNR